MADEATAEDLVQEVFLKALAAERRDGGAATPTRPAAWLHAIARNALVDHYRARRATEPLDALASDPAVDEPDDAVAHRALAACLRPFAEELPPIYRDTLLAVDFEGRSMAGLAEEWGLSRSAVKSRAARAPRALRRLTAARPPHLAGPAHRR